VARSGETCESTVKEFGIVEAFMAASPAVLSTEDLLERGAWDEHTDPFTNTVQVAVGCVANSARST
jgi:DNA-binding response OmpR family regulator